MKDKISFIFDTETNGFANCSVLSISFIICKDSKILNEQTRYYYPKESYYNKHAITVNRLEKDVIEKHRKSIDYPLYFENDAKWLIDIMNEYNVNNIVAHNTNFDLKFLPSRIKEKIEDNIYSTFCTMKKNREFVGIKKGNGYKNPKLSEACNAHGIAFDNDEAHSSDYDTLKAYELFLATIKFNNKENTPW